MVQFHGIGVGHFPRPRPPPRPRPHQAPAGGPPSWLRCSAPSGTGGCRREPGCRRPGRWPPTSAWPGAPWPTPTTNSWSRVGWRPATARARRWRGRRPVRGGAAAPATRRRRRGAAASTSARAVPTSRPSPAANGWRPCAACCTSSPTLTCATATHAGWRRCATVIADYVARTRGVRADPGRIVITSGFTQALAVLAAAFADLGATSVALEDPCIPAYRDAGTARRRAGPRAARRRRGRRSVVARHRVRCRCRRAHARRTSTRSAPRSAPARRTAVIGWAREADVVRGRGRLRRRVPLRPPAGRLRCRRWTPTAPCTSAPPARAWRRRCGWRGWCCRRRSSTPSSRPRSRADRHTSVLDQATLAELIRSGALDRHVRRSAGCATAAGATRSSRRWRPCPRCERGASPPASTPCVELTGGPAGSGGGGAAGTRPASPCTGSSRTGTADRGRPAWSWGSVPLPSTPFPPPWRP